MTTTPSTIQAASWSLRRWALYLKPPRGHGQHGVLVATIRGKIDTRDECDIDEPSPCHDIGEV